jgi:beta-xylosidase
MNPRHIFSLALPSILGFCLLALGACSQSSPSGSDLADSSGSAGQGGDASGTTGAGGSSKQAGASATTSSAGGGGLVSSNGSADAGRPGGSTGVSSDRAGALAGSSGSKGGSITSSAGSSQGGASSGGTTTTRNPDAGQGGVAGASGGATIPQGGAAGTNTAEGGKTGSAGSTGTCTDTTFKNPVMFEDLPDSEVIRVDNVFYYSASSFHFSPGAPVLRSYDLVHWEYIAHSVPVLDFNNNYSLSGGRAYNDGIWASSLQYRKSDKTFYWVGCMHGQGGGYLYKATNIEGPWTKHKTSYCHYDVGLLIDDDDTMYTASGNTALSVAQLSKDGLSSVKSQVVYTSGAEGALEGSRFYKIKGNYYIMPTQYANGEYILKASNPFGPYTLYKFAVKLKSPITPEPTLGGAPHQGSIVDTPSGDWYYMAFIDAYPAGRIPVLAPITWSTDGWPSVVLDSSGGWGLTYPMPKGLPCTTVKSRLGPDSFSEKTLGHEWEWNHNPDNTKWSSGSGLTLQTATVTDDLYAARNTLTRRVVGPTSTATITMDLSNMKDGDVAGLALFRPTSAWVGVKKTAGATKVVMTNGLSMTASYATSNKGTEAESAAISGTKIWLRIAADVTPGTKRQAKFYYSTDGSKFTQIGSVFTLDSSWSYFLGYRYAIFNYATTALGGSVTIASFEQAQP